MFNGSERGNAESLSGHLAAGAQDYKRPPDQLQHSTVWSVTFSGLRCQQREKIKHASVSHKTNTTLQLPILC